MARSQALPCRIELRRGKSSAAAEAAPPSPATPTPAAFSEGAARTAPVLAHEGGGGGAVHKGYVLELTLPRITVGRSHLPGARAPLHMRPVDAMFALRMMSLHEPITTATLRVSVAHVT